MQALKPATLRPFDPALLKPAEITAYGEAEAPMPGPAAEASPLGRPDWVEV